MLTNPDIGDAPLCVHHWVIEAARGVTSNGECNKCGEVREFLNWQETDPKKQRRPLPRGRHKEQNELIAQGLNF